MKIVGVDDVETLLQQHQQWLNNEALVPHAERDINWSESLAVVNEAFVDEVRAFLGSRAKKEKSSNRWKACASRNA